MVWKHGKIRLWCSSRVGMFCAFTAWLFVKQTVEGINCHAHADKMYLIMNGCYLVWFQSRIHVQDIMWTPIPFNQYLSPVTQLVPYTQMHSQCGTGLQELILQNLWHWVIFCLIRLTVLQCVTSTEGNNDPHATPTSGKLMGLLKWIQVP